jgi:DNA-binding MarR family transcriptional regulator
VSPGEELLQTIVGLRRALRRRQRAVIPLPPLRGARLELLQCVEAEPGIGVAAAAKALHLAPNSVSTLVNTLVSDGLLHRSTDAADRRAVRLELAPAAVERLARTRALRRELVETAFEALSEADRAAIEAALPALQRLLVEVA